MVKALHEASYNDPALAVTILTDLTTPGRHQTLQPVVDLMASELKGDTEFA